MRENILANLDETKIDIIALDVKETTVTYYGVKSISIDDNLVIEFSFRAKEGRITYIKTFHDWKAFKDFIDKERKVDTSGVLEQIWKNMQPLEFEWK